MYIFSEYVSRLYTFIFLSLIYYPMFIYIDPHIFLLQISMYLETLEDQN